MCVYVSEINVSKVSICTDPFPPPIPLLDKVKSVYLIMGLSRTSTFLKLECGVERDGVAF